MRRRQRSAVSTHSRPKAAGTGYTPKILGVPGFNTQPPEGGWVRCRAFFPLTSSFQHTAARRRLAPPPAKTPKRLKFQHTAARRRLAFRKSGNQSKHCVSTHSRPKAAGRQVEAVWQVQILFQHTAARRRLA